MFTGFRDNSGTLCYNFGHSWRIKNDKTLICAVCGKEKKRKQI